jgi:arginyl-tRNA synthetase
LKELLVQALEAARVDGVLQTEGLPDVALERPKRREHGDWATNVALQAARVGGNPREIAQGIVDRLPPSPLVARVEIAGPGFLNFRLSQEWLSDVVRRAADDSVPFGRSGTGAGTNVNVEYVSANPTGPVNIVSGRHAAIGDAIANLLEATGHGVTREFYINDAGRQMRLFGESLAARYLQQLGRDAELPEDGYRGEYLIDMAARIVAEHGDRYAGLPADERNATLGRLGLAISIEGVKTSLERFGTRFDVWFSEAALHDEGAVERAVDNLKSKGLIEERDGALWFKTTQFGDDRDRVIVRSDGVPTYLAADVAYMGNKFSRGFSRLIYLLGADHHGTLPRLRATAEALGHGRDKVEFPLVQVVTIKRGGRALKGSKRAGVIELLDDLVEEVGADAVRYTFLTRSIDSPLEFDVELVKEQAPENPVYYVQYAHARICSILRKANEEGASYDPASAPLDLLVHPSEDDLIRKLAAYEEAVPEAAFARAPQKLTRYLEELATSFSAFYRDCKVIGSDAGMTAARLSLCSATRRVLADGLGIAGVSAPERM